MLLSNEWWLLRQQQSRGLMQSLNESRRAGQVPALRQQRTQESEQPHRSLCTSGVGEGGSEGTVRRLGISLHGHGEF